jgi:hypothetical protein
VQFHVIINPVITFLRNDTVDFYEGCLSLAGFSACLVVSVLARRTSSSSHFVSIVMHRLPFSYLQRVFLH